ncbi:hypothetical protein [Hyunsoonleella ulvae]|uniref:hypothetical protein n=1 Tax=Hyunsoonleella ulvae TaxID=2799948 RepID=UPI00193ACC49|nr:hypothetical protein [Hyunsoonleella ulvae]
MSDEILRNIFDENNNLGKYSPMIKKVIEWFSENPNRDLRADKFYSVFPPYFVDISLYILQKKGVLKHFYRVLDRDGIKIGNDYESLEDIPDVLYNDIDAPIDIDDVTIVHYYSKD